MPDPYEPRGPDHWNDYFLGPGAPPPVPPEGVGGGVPQRVISNDEEECIARGGTYNTGTGCSDQQTTGEGTGGGGGGGGGGASTSIATVAPPPPIPQYRPIQPSGPTWDLLVRGVEEAYNRLPYTDDVINAMKAKLFASSAGRTAAAKQAAGQDIVRRGLSRSGIATETLAGIERAGASDYSGGVRDILIKAAEENYKARLSALDRAKEVVALKAQYDLANARNQLDRDIAVSNAALGYARIQQEAMNLAASLDNAYAIARMNNAGALFRLLVDRGLIDPNAIPPEFLN